MNHRRANRGLSEGELVDLSTSAARISGPRGCSEVIPLPFERHSLDRSNESGLESLCPRVPVLRTSEGHDKDPTACLLSYLQRVTVTPPGERLSMDRPLDSLRPSWLSCSWGPWRRPSRRRGPFFGLKFRRSPLPISTTEMRRETSHESQRPLRRDLP